MSQSIRNLESAISTTKAAQERFSKVKKQAHNADVYALAKASEKECKRFADRKTELSADEMKAYSKALTQFRYRTELLLNGDSALKWMHDKGIKTDVTARNTYGKALLLIDKALGNQPMKYEQGAYAERLWDEIITQEKPKNGVIKITARKMSFACAAGDSQLGQTQPYALLKALEIVQAGTRHMAGRGTPWQESYFLLSTESDIYKAVNAK